MNDKNFELNCLQCLMRHSFHSGPPQIKTICLGLTGNFISRMTKPDSFWKQLKSEFVTDFENWMSENCKTHPVK